MHDRDAAPCNSWCGPTCAKSTRQGTVRSIGLICRAASSFVHFPRRPPTVLTPRGGPPDCSAIAFEPK
jgi:hypothetical protein